MIGKKDSQASVDCKSGYKDEVHSDDDENASKRTESASFGFVDVKTM